MSRANLLLHPTKRVKYIMFLKVKGCCNRAHTPKLNILSSILYVGSKISTSSWCVIPYTSAAAQGGGIAWETNYHRYNKEAIQLILVSIIQKKCITSTQHHHPTP